MLQHIFQVILCAGAFIAAVLLWNTASVIWSDNWRGSMLRYVAAVVLMLVAILLWAWSVVSFWHTVGQIIQH